MHLQASICECVFDEGLALEAATFSASRVSIEMEGRHQTVDGPKLRGPRFFVQSLSLA